LSATGRLLEREEHDFYATPSWCVDRLLEHEAFNLSVFNTIVDPCAGDGAILRTLRAHRTHLPKHTLAAFEIQARFKESLESVADLVGIGDALAFMPEYNGRGCIDLAITNPPFSLAFELLQALWPVAGRIALLLRLSFIASAKRHPFLKDRIPDVFVLPNRPIFVRGQSDNCDYGWFSWWPLAPDEGGHLYMLDLTPDKERRLP